MLWAHLETRRACGCADDEVKDPKWCFHLVYKRRDRGIRSSCDDEEVWIVGVWTVYFDGDLYMYTYSRAICLYHTDTASFWGLVLESRLSSSPMSTSS